MLRPCPRPRDLTGAETVGQQARRWLDDRRSLADYADRHAVAVSWIEAVAAALAGGSGSLVAAPSTPAD